MDEEGEEEEAEGEVEVEEVGEGVGRLVGEVGAEVGEEGEGGVGSKKTGVAFGIVLFSSFFSLFRTSSSC